MSTVKRVVQDAIRDGIIDSHTREHIKSGSQNEESDWAVTRFVWYFELKERFRLGGQYITSDGELVLGENVSIPKSISESLESYEGENKIA